MESVYAEHPFEMIPLVYHVWWPSSSDPFYQGNIPENTARTQYYNVTGVPQVWIDGIVDGGTGGSLEQQMLTRGAVSSPLTISLTGQTFTPDTGEITAEITNTSGGTITGNLHFVLVENDCQYAGKPWNFVMRDFFPADQVGEPITIPSGQVLQRTAPFTIASGWVRDNMLAIVFVQNNSTKEVYQTARIFLPPDGPALMLADTIFDDSYGGDGDGYLDLGESVAMKLALTNANPVAATGTAGTLATSDPYLTVVDATATWPDIAGGSTEQNDADPFAFAIASNAPPGRFCSATVAVTADGGYATDFPLTIGIGAPENVIGPDDYAYYAYENVDTAPAPPTYSWVEIDPNLGGPGTMISLGDDSTVGFDLPFSFRYYGAAFTRVSVCSNGWIALGTTTATDYGNAPIPSTIGPPNMVAAFWMDLNPSAAGSGKVYRYSDTANHRVIVEYSGVEHYHPQGLGVPEKFEFILYDPAYYPTPTNDGEIAVQYALVSDASTCTAGIENSTETIGIQYLYNGLVNPAGTGLVAGRVIKYSTMPPNSSGVDEGVRPSVVLLQSRPNPARGGSQIHYDVPTAGHVSLRVFDATGAVVRTLIDRTLPAGPGSIAWDGRGDRGENLASGVYFYRLSGDGFSVDRKIVKQD